MSFIGVMKDKTWAGKQRNVLHQGDEGQNAGRETAKNTLHPGLKCPFEPAKRTKGASFGLEMSF
ncbi:UNVERIFIED_ORG: hypothetical protein ABRZ91_003167 [Heyndrickxia coagulans]